MSALARWDAFLGQIEARAAQVRTEAETSARAFIAEVAHGGDYAPLSHQLMAVRNRLLDLESNITDTWHAKVDAAIAAEGLGEVAEEPEECNEAADDLGVGELILVLLKEAAGVEAVFDVPLV